MKANEVIVGCILGRPRKSLFICFVKAKKVIVYLARVKPERLIDELMNELRVSEQ